jgi:hypothetical protein
VVCTNGRRRKGADEGAVVPQLLPPPTFGLALMLAEGGVEPKGTDLCARDRLRFARAAILKRSLTRG